MIVIAGVPEPFGDDGQRDARGQQRRRRGVPQVVEPDPRDAEPVACLAELARHGLGPRWSPTASVNTSPSRSCHAVPAALRANRCRVRCISRACRAASGSGIVRRDRADFGSASAQPLPCVAGQRPRTVSRSVGHVAPSQPEQLAEPEPGGRGERVDRAELVVGRRRRSAAERRVPTGT